MALAGAAGKGLAGGGASIAYSNGGSSAMAPCLGSESAAVVVVVGGSRSELLRSSGWALRRTALAAPRRRGGGGMEIMARSGGGGQPYRPRVSTGPRRGPNQQQDSGREDGPLLNTDIRAPYVRLLDQEQNMIGVVSTSEALSRSREADLDLVMISPDADPPVVRIMDYSKYRYELQKKKREAQKKAAANRQVLKELKMRYNIDTHDYAVRQRAAQRFLKDGDKVKVVCQFKGREMDFKDLAVKLFQRFQDEIGAMALLETKISLEGKTMFMVLAPNKAVIVKEKAAAQVQATKGKTKSEAKSETNAAEDAAQTSEDTSQVLETQASI